MHGKKLFHDIGSVFGILQLRLLNTYTLSVRGSRRRVEFV